jgi:hypothetical protein
MDLAYAGYLAVVGVLVEQSESRPASGTTLDSLGAEFRFGY